MVCVVRGLGLYESDSNVSGLGFRRALTSVPYHYYRIYHSVAKALPYLCQLSLALRKTRA